MTYKEALEKIATVNAMDYEYQAWAREALAQPEHGWTTEQLAGIARLKEAQDKKLSQHTWVGLTPQERDEINE